MEHRFVVFDGESEPRIYKVPLNKTARLINDFQNRKPAVFETLKDAKEAALAIVDRAEEKARPNIGMFAARPRASQAAWIGGKRVAHPCCLAICV